MSRTHKDRLPAGICAILVGGQDGAYIPRWSCPGEGRYWKRRYHKAMRQWQRGHGGREHAVLHYGRECNWKLT
ncbi:MAG: hypothetical protein EHM35_00470 [Planctomycetaceae bacterium]|nr:MAG: hypothetical protein EHM35_00470 [Planctomycetaceae bacterium]